MPAHLQSEARRLSEMHEKVALTDDVRMRAAVLDVRRPIRPAGPPKVLQRISRFALQQRSRIDAPDRADGTRRLMWAILKDTLACYHAHARATTVHGQRLFREAERWVQSSDVSWMFSFENVCAVLEIDGEALRNELRRWRRARQPA